MITVPVGDEVVVPATEPNWGYQAGQNGCQRRDCKVHRLLQGMEMVSNKPVNVGKCHEIMQGADENLAIFLNRLITRDPIYLP